MRCILAADSIHASRALQTARPPTIIFALSSNPGEQFWLRRRHLYLVTLFVLGPNEFLRWLLWIFGDSYDERLLTFPASLCTRRIDGLASLEAANWYCRIGFVKALVGHELQLAPPWRVVQLYALST